MPLLPLPDDCPKDKEYLAPCPCFSKEDGGYLCLNLDSIKDVLFFDLMCCTKATEASPETPVCMNCLYVEQDG